MPTLTAGPETLVNTTIIGGQHSPEIAALSGGGLVVVWRDSGTSDGGIMAQRYDSGGAKVGGELQVTPNVPGDNFEARAAGLSSGGFVVAWSDTQGDASGWGIKARIYDASGAPLGAEFLVNSLTNDTQWQPDVVALPGGGFLIAWSHRAGDSSLDAVKAQTFDATGSRVGSEFQVNTTEYLLQGEPKVAVLASGGMVIVWNDASQMGGDTTGYSVKGQRFDTAGNRVGVEFVVNTTVLGDQGIGNRSVTALPSGGFVVSWMDNSGLGGDSSGTSIKGQIFDSEGLRVGSEFLVNTNTPGYQLNPVILAFSSGGFVVAWDDPTGDESGGAIKAQIFDAAGEKSGGELLINSTTSGLQVEPTITAFGSGFAIAWTEYSGIGDDPSESGVKMRLFTSGNVINGTEGDDFIVGTPGDDAINGLGGNDVLQGGTGDDSLDGGDGLDAASYASSTGPVEVNLATGQSAGPDGSDSFAGIENVFGSTYDDVLTGDAAINWLVGADGNDVLEGGGGDDVLEGQGGDDTLHGGAGFDMVSYHSASGAVQVDLSTGQATGADGNDSLDEIEQVFASEHDDLLIGDGGTNGLIGAGGNDQIFGGGGRDTLDGGEGDDSLDGEQGDDHLLGGGGDDILQDTIGYDLIEGGPGIDTVSYADAVGRVELDLAFGAAEQYAADGTFLDSDTLTGIENVTGSEFDDVLLGDSAENLLDGLGGNDFLRGGAGDDALYGGEGNDTLRGDASDAFIGPSGNDTLYGGNGNDVLRGGLGDDDLFGGDDDDHLRGNGGVDYFDGGAETGLLNQTSTYGDRVSFFEVRATQGVVADLRTGVISDDGFGNVETMVGIESLGGDTAYADTFHGNDSRNAIFVSRGDSLYGHGGDDLLFVSSAAALVDGGAGTDVLSLGAFNFLLPDADADGVAEDVGPLTSGWTVNLAAGSMLDGDGYSGTVTGIENVDGSAFDDTMIGDANNNVLNGLDGDDTLEGCLGDDTLDGGDGNDTASYASAAGGVDVVLQDGTIGGSSGSDGNDTLIDVENVTGSEFNDGITGNGLANVLSGLGGDDEIAGGVGDDAIDGGDGRDFAIYAGAGGSVVVNLTAGTASGADGNDTLASIEDIQGSSFDDQLIGDGGSNMIVARAGDDIIEGGGGHDSLSGQQGNDTLGGGDGHDFFRGGTGDDFIDGGDGYDRASYFGDPSLASGVVVSLLLQGTSQDTGRGWDILTGIEALSGSEFDDQLTGDNDSNWLSAASGNDSLFGEDGDDLLQARGVGDHSFDGGDGIDTASFHEDFEELGQAATVSLLLQGMVQDTGLGMMVLNNIENLSGGQFDDHLTGNGGANVLAGGDGHDTLSGRGGDDTLYGDGLIEADIVPSGFLSGPITLFEDIAAGNDILEGGKGDDWLFGGGGDDELRGGKDDDTLIGGAGNDELRGGDGRDTFRFGPDSGDDRIADFGNRDTIAFVGIAGVDDFGDLTMTRIGRDTLITWGDGTNTILVEDIRPNQFNAADFMFG